jgi:hypothetical protein
VDALLAFGAGVLALRLAGALLSRWRARRVPAYAAWAGGLGAYAVAAAALAWGTAAGWDDRAFRVYYLCGGLLTAPLLGAGSLLFVGRRWATPLALVYTGVALGVAVAMAIDPHVRGDELPRAGEHVAFVPARLVAVAANSLGTLAVVAVALATLRRRPVGNALVLAGVGVAATGTGVAPGAAWTAATIAAGAVLLYAGFVA